MIAIKSKASPRPSPKAAPACETMEGRLLLNGAGWGAGMAAGKLPPADHHALANGGAGDRSFTPPTLSAAAKAAMTQLQTDSKALQTEVQANATVQADEAAVKADWKAIASALGVSTTTRTTWTTPDGKGSGAGADPGLAVRFTGRGPGGPIALGAVPIQVTGTMPIQPGGPMIMAAGANGAGTAPTLPAALTAKLTAAGISSTTITNDMTRLQDDIKAVDPTLAAKVQADETAVQAAMPAPTMHFDHIVNATSTSTTTATTG